jgi:hypothetical protein
MTRENKDKLKNQRVFQHTSGLCILLTKAGKAVSFRDFPNQDAGTWRYYLLRLKP